MELLKPYVRENAFPGISSALAISLAAHLAFLLVLGLAPEPPAYTERTIRVSIAEPPKTQSTLTEAPPALPPPTRQIVSPSEAPEIEPSTPTPYRSERDSSTPREQVKRGDGASNTRESSDPQITRPRQKPRPSLATPATEPATRPLPGAGSLRLTERALQERILSNAPSAKPSSSADPRTARLDSYKPFSKGNTLSSGLPGIPDYLPGIPDGDITLLNAKADRFAVFVRRVAVQVFGALRSTHWREVPYSEVQRLSEMATVKATLSKSGKLLRVEILESSGSRVFDNALQRAVQTGAWDQNPPEAAVAEDGNIQFIFRSQTWARRGPEGIGEQRWLLLATGLQ